uniref:Ig-like domain-containing protein n=1 Tax=Latimeria chalumnae TaxID=7897 RepID=H3AB59_LATCH
TGVNIYQRRSGCEMDADGNKTRGFNVHSYNGKDYIEFDTETQKWKASSEFAETQEEDNNKNTALFRQKCQSLPKCASRSSSTICMLANRIMFLVPPEVRVVDKKSDNGETLTLSCMVTGFYPRAVDVNWIKNGETTLTDVQSSGILPNEDRTFQIQKSIEIYPADNNIYSCQVEHSSLNTALNVPYDPRANYNLKVILGITTPLGILVIVLV